MVENWHQNVTLSKPLTLQDTNRNFSGLLIVPWN